ncbi:hypothetical protein HDU67_002312 [Dinochytrium kinnereticum]|nr:hypothetical protein HDU67_002312 [Dinochytrium kinnereticum]
MELQQICRAVAVFATEISSGLLGAISSALIMTVVCVVGVVGSAVLSPLVVIAFAFCFVFDVLFRNHTRASVKINLIMKFPLQWCLAWIAWLAFILWGHFTSALNQYGVRTILWPYLMIAILTSESLKLMTVGLLKKYKESGVATTTSSFAGVLGTIRLLVACYFIDKGSFVGAFLSSMAWIPMNSFLSLMSFTSVFSLLTKVKSKDEMDECHMICTAGYVIIYLELMNGDAALYLLYRSGNDLSFCIGVVSAVLWEAFIFWYQQVYSRKVILKQMAQVSQADAIEVKVEACETILEDSENALPMFPADAETKEICEKEGRKSKSGQHPDASILRVLDPLKKINEGAQSLGIKTELNRMVDVPAKRDETTAGDGAVKMESAMRSLSRRITRRGTTKDMHAGEKLDLRDRLAGLHFAGRFGGIVNASIRIVLFECLEVRDYLVDKKPVLRGLFIHAKEGDAWQKIPLQNTILRVSVATSFCTFMILVLGVVRAWISGDPERFFRKRVSAFQPYWISLITIAAAMQQMIYIIVREYI